jgi:hypothetical protein
MAPPILHWPGNIPVPSEAPAAPLSVATVQPLKNEEKWELLS